VVVIEAEVIGRDHGFSESVSAQLRRAIETRRLDLQRQANDGKLPPFKDGYSGETFWAIREVLVPPVGYEPVYAPSPAVMQFDSVLSAEDREAIRTAYTEAMKGPVLGHPVALTLTERSTLGWRSAVEGDESFIPLHQAVPVKVIWRQRAVRT
jgi:hypothetical protein